VHQDVIAAPPSRLSVAIMVLFIFQNSSLLHNKSHNILAHIYIGTNKPFVSLVGVVWDDEAMLGTDVSSPYGFLFYVAKSLFSPFHVLPI
jgi:hypothetical protein